MDVDPAHATAYIINPFTGRKVELRELLLEPPADGRPRRAPPPHALIPRIRNHWLHFSLGYATMSCTSDGGGTMADIRHRVEISAPAKVVYDAIATPEGVATWWTRTAR